MPTTKLKNAVYRILLPLKAPGPGREIDFRTEGRPLLNKDSYIRLLRRHHVMGSAGLGASGNESLVLLSSSVNPSHRSRRSSLFRVASITKMAAALCILRLYEKGLLDLDSPLPSFFPDSKMDPALNRITPRLLLSHTAGLSDPPRFEDRLLKGIPFTEFLSECLSGTPGETFRYSNLGYGLLGCIMEAATGKTVSRVFEEEVFHPLAMRSTLEASSLSPEEIMPVCRILPYQPGNDILITELGKIPLSAPDPMRHYGHSAGSMYTDIDSLFKLVSCLRDHGRPLLSPETGRLMSEKKAEYGRRSPTMSYGLGLVILQDPSLSSSRILGHQGYAYGCADGAFWEEDTGNIIIFLNGGCSEARRGMLGCCNYDMLRFFLRKEFPAWQRKQR